MNLEKIGSNMMQIKLGTKIILISYQTPVAYLDMETLKAYQTEKRWSATTKRHISKWLGAHPEVWGAEYKPQEFFDGLLAVVK